MRPPASSRDIICDAVGLETPTSSQMRFLVSGPRSSSTARPARSFTAPSQEGVPVVESAAIGDPSGRGQVGDHGRDELLASPGSNSAAESTTIQYGP